MGLITTKLTKSPQSPQQWVASELTNGDILDLNYSLGGRPAHSVTIESIGGESTVRFNVCKKIYKQPGKLYNSWIGLGQGLGKPAPLLVDEIEETTTNIVIGAGIMQQWLASEVAVNDIRIVSKSTGLKITCT